MSSPRRIQLLFWGALTLGLSCLFSLVWLTLLYSRSNAIVLESCDASYCVRVVEGLTERRLLTSEQLYELQLSRKGSPDYGYVVRHSFAWHGFDTAATIRASKIEWSSAGMTLTEPTGQSLFVPQKLYAGGR
jgi:hypothetical protein